MAGILSYDELQFSQLAERLAAGDPKVEALVVNRFTVQLVALARRELADRICQKSSPEDAVQSAFKSFLTSLILTIIVVCPTSVVIASDIEMSLQVRSAKQRVSTTHTEEQPLQTKPKPRPVLTSGEHEELLVSWKATNVSKHDTFQDVLIHCMVVSELAAGQATTPQLKDPVQESALTMDFKPGSSASGTFSLMIDRAGTYLVRVETRNILEKHGHERYVAIDLVRK